MSDIFRKTLQLESIKATIEGLKMQSNMMKTANQARLADGLALAYPPAQFDEIADIIFKYADDIKALD